MNAVRARKEAAKRLGIALQMQYRALLEATGSDAIETAAINLGGTFNTNVEFIINVLKEKGGVPVTYEPMTRRAELPVVPMLLHNGE